LALGERNLRWLCAIKYNQSESYIDKSAKLPKNVDSYPGHPNAGGPESL